MPETGADATSPSEPSGLGAFAILAAITIVTLVVMAIVLTRDPAPDTGRRTSSGSGSGSSSQAEAAASTTSGTAPKAKPGVVQPLPDLDESTGWTTDIGVANGKTCAGPTMQRDIVAVFCETRHLVGFDVTSGEQLWDTKIDEAHQDFTAAPLAAGTHSLVVVRDNEIVAVDAKTGEVAWRVLRNGLIFGVTASDTHVFVIGGGRAAALDPETGAVQWESSFADGVFTEGPFLLDASNVDLVVAIGHGIQTFDVETGEAHWTATTGDPKLASLAAEADGVYVISTTGTVTSLDPRSGSSRWERAGSFDGEAQVISGLDHDTVYVSSNNEIGALSRQDGSERWSFTSQEAMSRRGGLDRSRFEDGHLITGGDGAVWLVDPATGEVKAGKRLVVASPGQVRGNQLFLLQATYSTPSWRLVVLAL
jgi:outer membrane protein assembly factor BamB